MVLMIGDTLPRVLDAMIDDGGGMQMRKISFLHVVLYRHSTAQLNRTVYHHRASLVRIDQPTITVLHEPTSCFSNEEPQEIREGLSIWLAYGVVMRDHPHPDPAP